MSITKAPRALVHLSILVLLVVLGVVDASSAGFDPTRIERSYPFGDLRVPLDLDSGRVAVLLDPDLEDEIAFLNEVTESFAEFAAPLPSDRQGYAHLWFLRTATDLGFEEEIFEQLSAIPGVRFAAPIFRYGDALMIPKPELLIAFDGAESTRVADLEEELGAERIGEIPGLRTTFHLRVPQSAWQLFARTRELALRDGVARVEPNFIVQRGPSATPNDPRFANQWHHQNTGQTGGTVGADMSSTNAWDFETGSASTVIAVIDEGVDMDHEDLAAHVVGGHDSTDQPWPEGVAGNALPTNGHGTSCAGIAAAIGNNSIGVAGVCWTAGILSVRIGYADYWTENAWCADGITWATDNGADVLSNSWGGGAPSSAIQSAIQYATTVGRGGLGAPVLFSSGNGNSAVSYPAAHPEAIAVGASSPCDERKNPSSCDGENWWGSNYGDGVDVAAPGVKI
ncbi:MAG: S8 family serine peptidase [Planctomycetes bacterium]|nr:S8 family serine peptidase [Planctomycetota bacterium]